MKKILLTLTIFILGTSIAYAAPTYRIERTILPETDSTYELGTSTKSWLRVFSDKFFSPGISDGCATWSSTELTSTGSSCGAGLQTYFFTASTSDIATYYVAKNIADYVVGTVQVIPTAGVSVTPTLLGTFATASNFPSLTSIPAGNWDVHYDTEKVAGSNNYYTYAEIYKRDTGGIETLIVTTDISTQSASNAVISTSVSGATVSATTLNTTDRIITKVYGVMLSSTATINLRVDDATSAKVSFPSTSVDTSSFVPYHNWLYDVNAGIKNLFTSTGKIGIGTSSPYAPLSVVGEVVASYYTATSTTATSTFAGALGIGTTTSNPNNLIQVTDLINFDNVNLNTFLGYQTGKYLPTGAIRNTYVGYQTGLGTSTTATSDDNTGLGYFALNGLTTGSLNTAVGVQSQFNTTTGTANTSVGYQSLLSNTTGFNNVAIGRGALRNNIGGAGNTGIGLNAGTNNVSGTDNFYLGQASGQNGTSATDMVCIGRSSCLSNVVGTQSVAIGRNAGNAFTGTGNVMIGYYAGAYETGTSTFYLNNADQTTLNGDRANSLMWGRFGGISNSFLTINSSTTIKQQLIVTGSNAGTTLTTYQAAPNISILNTNTTNNNFSPLDFRTNNASASAVSTSMITGIHTSHTTGAESGAIAFHTNNAGTFSEKLRITPSGNVGLGTTSPFTLLGVVGTITTNNINATSTNATSTFSGAIKANDYYGGAGGKGFTGTCILLGLTSITVEDGLIISCQ